MNSKTLVKRGFEKEWLQFSESNKGNLIKKLPIDKGVYVIKFKKEFCRFKEKSDIVYIGSTKCNGGLKKRISLYFYSDAEFNVQVQHKS